MNRRKYPIDIVVNGISVRAVVIDPHYEEKHSESIDDGIILGLVGTLHGKMFEPDDENPPYQYFVTDKIEHEGKYYKLIWLLENHQIYIGVVNAYRRSEKWDFPKKARSTEP